MRGVAVLIALALAVAGCDDSNDNPAGPSNTGPIVFTAQLSAANEVPAVTGPEANGRGNVTITFNVPRDAGGGVTGAGTASFAIQLSGFPPGTPISVMALRSSTSSSSRPSSSPFSTTSSFTVRPRWTASLASLADSA